VLSCGTSIDGYLDDATGDRLVLSNEADLDRVDEVRAGCDASWSVPPPSAPTTRGCWCETVAVAPRGSPAVWRRRRSR